jgi:succinate-semialdehyde dehydrogenase / glutarate-semialdehyde dehydrogenase
MALEESTIAFADPALLRERAYIDGEWCDADDGATFEVTNPATGEVLGRVPRMGAAETRRAVQTAQCAQVQWARRPAAERASILRALRDLMMAHRDDLALLLTLEQGKPLAESLAERGIE